LKVGEIAGVFDGGIAAGRGQRPIFCTFLVEVFAIREYSMPMNLKPQDIVVVLKLLVSDKEASYSALAYKLCMSPSEVHAAVKRAALAGLIDASTKEVKRKPLLEFLIHGLKYAFPPTRGTITRGIPTAHAAPPLSDRLSGKDDLPPVWPCADGTVRGHEFKPLYRCVPAAAREDAGLYELLVLVDAVRGGRARERKLAEQELTKRLESQ
jgi:DNA-binding Lrp family transcriptional regulator